MRVERWDMSGANRAIGAEGHRRALKAANIIADAARARCPVGTEKRPMYKKGPYAGKPFTARDGGALKKSIRVVERDEEKYGFEIAHLGSGVRVYAGHYLAYYAAIVEFFSPFIRPARDATRNRVKDILENG